MKINECYADYSEKPRFEVTDNAFKLTLPNINFAGEHKPPSPAEPPKADREQILLDLAEKQGYIIRKDVERALQVSQATAILILRDMVQQGLLIKEGSGKQQRYLIGE